MSILLIYISPYLKNLPATFNHCHAVFSEKCKFLFHYPIPESQKYIYSAINTNKNKRNINDKIWDFKTKLPRPKNKTSINIWIL